MPEKLIGYMDRDCDVCSKKKECCVLVEGECSRAVCKDCLIEEGTWDDVKPRGEGSFFR